MSKRFQKPSRNRIDFLIGFEGQNGRPGPPKMEPRASQNGAKMVAFREPERRSKIERNLDEFLEAPPSSPRPPDGMRAAWGETTEGGLGS